MSNEENEHHNPGKTEPEIRYVPLDIRAIENENDEINIFQILRTFWEGRKTILKTIAVFGVIGLFVALISVEEYMSEVRVLPESQESVSLGALGGLAQQFGISAAPQSSGEGIPANLYPAIIESNIFLEELMTYEVLLPKESQRVTLETYFRNYQSWSLFKYTVMLPLTIKKWLTIGGENEFTSLDHAYSNEEKLNRLVHMSRDDWETLREIRGRISTSLDSETGTVTVRVKIQDPFIAADVADEIVQMLSHYITEKRTEKARQDVRFIEERFEEAKASFEEAQKELAVFNDANRGQLTAMARTEEQLLQSRYNLNFNLYNSLAERLEQSRIKLQEETPMINILEPAAVPDKRSEPKRTMILTVFILFGGFIGLSIVLFKTLYIKFIDKLGE